MTSQSHAWHGLQLGGISFNAGLWDKCTFISEMWRSRWDKTGQGRFDCYGSYWLIPASPSPCLCVVLETDWFFSVLLKTLCGNLTMWVKRTAYFYTCFTFMLMIQWRFLLLLRLFQIFIDWTHSGSVQSAAVGQTCLMSGSLCAHSSQFFLPTNDCDSNPTFRRWQDGWWEMAWGHFHAQPLIHTHTRAAALSHVRQCSYGCSLLPSSG